jgi:hypothetical protein
MQGFRCGLAVVTALLVVTALQAVAINANQAGARADTPEPQTQTAAGASAKYDCPKPVHKHKRKHSPAPIQTPPPPDCVAAPPPPPPPLMVGPIVPLPGPPIHPPVDEHLGSYLAWVAANLEILGLFLLAREVLWGHDMEEIRTGFESGAQVVYLYTRQDYDGAYLLLLLEKGHTPEVARAMVQNLGPAPVKTAVENEWKRVARELPQKYRRYREETEPKAMERRRFWLITGTGCLMIAAVIHIFA